MMVDKINGPLTSRTEVADTMLRCELRIRPIATGILGTLEAAYKRDVASPHHLMR